MAGTCKDCRFWEDGVCDMVDTCGVAAKPETLFQIEAWADDDSNLGAKLRTGPDFGCIHHVPAVNGTVHNTIVP